MNADATATDDGPHVVVSHSMGTVISYDCLKNLEAQKTKYLPLEYSA
jgi:surfactin synthase thioesterase subunit